MLKSFFFFLLGCFLLLISFLAIYKLFFERGLWIGVEGLGELSVYLAVTYLGTILISKGYKAYKEAMRI